MSSKKGILFICLGNICRSPMAEAVFIHQINNAGDAEKWKVDSAGLGGWHEGSKPDKRAMKVLAANNIKYEHRARQISTNDFQEFDYIMGMDDQNMTELNRIQPKGSKAELHLLGSFDPQGERIIRDPYYDTDSAGFEKCYQQCMRSCAAFLEKHK